MKKIFIELEMHEGENPFSHPYYKDENDPRKQTILEEFVKAGLSDKEGNVIKNGIHIRLGFSTGEDCETKYILEAWENLDCN
jgi:hypothetical protein